MQFSTKNYEAGKKPQEIMAHSQEKKILTWKLCLKLRQRKLRRTKETKKIVLHQVENISKGIGITGLPVKMAA